jgi:hypothetical protein
MKVKFPRFDMRLQIASVMLYKALSIGMVVWIDPRQAFPLIGFGMIDIGLITYVVYRITENNKRKSTPALPRHSHATINGLEDGTAILLDILKETEISLRFVKGRADDLLAVLQTLREGPQAYKDKPTKIIRRNRVM